MGQLIQTLPMFAVCIIVCISKIIEISIQSVKTVLMVKGEKKLAAILGFFEVAMWGIVISSVIGMLAESPALLFFYCLGYALGLYIGSTIESKIAIGTSCVQIMIKPKYLDVVCGFLTEHGKGYTIVDAHGAKEAMNIMYIVLPRKEVRPIMKELKALCDNDVFEITSEVNHFKGGYGVRK